MSFFQTMSQGVFDGIEALSRMPLLGGTAARSYVVEETPSPSGSDDDEESDDSEKKDDADMNETEP